MNVLSLFAGIGGLELGLERAGITVVGQVEIDPWCRRVLAKHWPDVPRHDDVRTAAEWWQSEERPNIDLVAGGPPCQPFSGAGRSSGASDDRNGWPWFLDVVRTVRPRYVIAENADELLSPRFHQEFSEILVTLADLGFAVEWDVVSACALGAPHPRRRLFLVAYPDSEHGKARLGTGTGRALQGIDRNQGAWSDRIIGSLETSRSDDRETDGSARRMVEAGGNAVVPAVGESIGRLLMALAA